MEDMKCTICNGEYNFVSRIPRLLPSCGHTICSTCAQDFLQTPDQIVCPQDKVKFNIQHVYIGLENFPINFALMSLLKKQNTQQQQQQNKPQQNQIQTDKCIIHQKVCDLICLTDFKFICAECILFGDHKLHQFQKMSEFQDQVKIQIKALEKNTQKFLTQKSFFNDRFLEVKKREAKEKIDLQIQQIKNFVEQLNEKMHEQINEKFQLLEQKQKNIKAKNQEILIEVECIKNQIMLVKQNVQSDHPDNKQLLEKLYKNDNIISKFNVLQNEQKELQDQIKTQINSQCSDINIDIRSSLINQFIEQNCVIKFEKFQQVLEQNMKKSMKSLCSKTADDLSENILLKSNDSDLILNEEEEDNDNELIDNLSVDQFFKEQKKKQDNKFSQYKNSAHNFYKHASSKSFYLPQSTIQHKKLPFEINKKNTKKKTLKSKILNMSYRRVESNKDMNILADPVMRPRKSFQKNKIQMKKQQTATIGNMVLTNQTTLDLSNQNMNDNDIDIITEQLNKNSQYKKLDLSYNKFTQKGFKKILKIIQKQKIENIDFSSNQIDNEILPFLEKVMKKKRFKLKINLMNNKIILSSQRQKFLTKAFCSKGLIICF